ncbi:MAG TPA: hypothetical protein VGR38_04545, partial [Candidatus Polarisedimenticolia bacterium]|nr:hypothetical protein [Candidatus Polarisedimenticolia bacterium]
MKIADSGQYSRRSAGTLFVAPARGEEVTTRLNVWNRTLPALLAPAVLFMLVPAATTLAQTTAPAAKPGLSIFFETQLPYFYEGDDLPVAMTVKNVTEATVDNSKGLDLL